MTPNLTRRNLPTNRNRAVGADLPYSTEHWTRKCYNPTGSLRAERQHDTEYLHGWSRAMLRARPCMTAGTTAGSAPGPITTNTISRQKPPRGDLGDLASQTVRNDLRVTSRPRKTGQRFPLSRDKKTRPDTTDNPLDQSYETQRVPQKKRPAFPPSRDGKRPPTLALVRSKNKSKGRGSRKL